MTAKPLGGQTRDLLERPWFLEQVGRPRDHGHFHLAAQLLERGSVQIQHNLIGPTDNEQRGGSDLRQSRASEIRAPAAGDDCGELAGKLGRRHQRCAGPGARPEIAEGQGRQFCLIADPTGGRDKPARQKLDVKYPCAIALLLRPQEVKQERPNAARVQHAGDLAIAGAEPTRAAAVSEHHQTDRGCREREVADYLGFGDADFAGDGEDASVHHD